CFRGNHPKPATTVTFYKLASPASQSLVGATLVGTAVTGTNGVASILYRMNTLAAAPAAGATLAFRAVYSGTPDMTFGGSMSTAVKAIQQRRTVVTFTVTRSGSAQATGTATLKSANVSYTTVSNNLSSTVAIAGTPIANAPLTLEWRKYSGSFLGSFSATTNT